MKKIRLFSLLLLVLAAAVALTACQGQTAEETAAPPPAASTATAIPPTATPIPPTATATPVPTVQPPEPQRITFEGEHGMMVGYYYPAAEINAPVVVLMHWAPGDQTDWCAIAPWLQNRADENPAPSERCAAALEDGGHPWLDASWFPPLPEGRSYAVFTFDFPGFGESQGTGYQDSTVALSGSRSRGNWNISRHDIQAAVETAAALPGVDPRRVILSGASIGADASATGCLLYNELYDGGCQGTFAFSPGDYLGESFVENTKTLEEKFPEVEQWCAHASEPQCGDAKDFLDQRILFPYGHGMELFAPQVYPMSPGRDATVMDFFVEFLDAIEQ